MDGLVDIIVNNGVAVGILVYFCWRDAKFMSNLDSALASLQASVDTITKLLEHNKEG